MESQKNVLVAWALLHKTFIFLGLLSRLTVGKKSGPFPAAEHKSDAPPVVSSLTPSNAHYTALPFRPNQLSLVITHSETRAQRENGSGVPDCQACEVLFLK